jgi:two-component system, NtrC family, response regulator HydG
MQPIPTSPLSEEITAILNSYDAPTIITNSEYIILAANKAYMQEYAENIQFGKSRCYEISHEFSVPCDQAGESCPLLASIESGVPQRVMHVHHTPRGREHVDVEIRPFQSPTDNSTIFMEIMRPVHLANVHSSARGLVGESPVFNKMLDLIRRVSSSNVTVLLQGESGTGKEVVARTIHDASERMGKPFVPVECSGLTETLFESELFGHEKGAFTGAHVHKIGLVESAHTGTLFLDEIGDIPLPLQVKLLRLLETHTYRKVGGLDPMHTDFRLICATHKNLSDMIEKEEFRLDLFYRISAFPIFLPGLKDRKEDLEILINSLLQRIEGGKDITVSQEAIECLKQYSFPGNVRELYNMLERASLLIDDPTIFPHHLPENVVGYIKQEQRTPCHFEEIISLQEMECQYLTQILNRFQDDKQTLAKKLGVSQRTLFRKIKECANK